MAGALSTGPGALSLAQLAIAQQGPTPGPGKRAHLAAGGAAVALGACLGAIVLMGSAPAGACWVTHG